MVQGGIRHFYLELWQPCCLAGRTICAILVELRRHHEDQFCEIILNLDQWFRCHLKILLIWSSGGHFDQRRGNYLCNFGRGYHEEQFCEIILFTKSRGYSNIKNYNIYQTNVINLKQLVLISKVISQSI